MALKPEQQAVELIGRAKNILLVTTEHASTDAIASMLALGLVLKKLNKPFDAVIPNFDAKNIPSFLPPGVEFRSEPGSMRSLRIKLNVKDVPLSELMYDVKDGQLEMTLVPKTGGWKLNDVSFANGDERYDLVIAFDAPDMASLGTLFRDHADFLYKTTIMNIDCGNKNEYWGQVNLVDLNCVSVTESVYQFIQTWNIQHLTPDIATAILAGMVSRTRSFRSANVTPKTLQAAAKLVELGARRAEIVQGLWRTQTVSTLKLWGRVLTHLQQDQTLGLVWSVLTERDFLDTGAKREALDGVVEELIGASPDAKVVALLSQTQNGVRVDVYAKAPQNAAELARPFGGTGTRERATFQWEGKGELGEETGRVVTKLRDTIGNT